MLEAKIRELQTTAATAEEKFGEDLRRTKAELIQLSEENVTLWADYNKLKADFAAHSKLCAGLS